MALVQPVRDELNKLKRAGNLRVSELCWWFDTPNSTMHTWLKGTRHPDAVHLGEVERRLRLLHLAVFTYHRFPIPRSIPFAGRKAYVSDVFAKPDRVIPASAPTGPRVQMRFGNRAKRIVAPDVGGDNGGVGKTNSGK